MKRVKEAETTILLQLQLRSTVKEKWRTSRAGQQDHLGLKGLQLSSWFIFLPIKPDCDTQSHIVTWWTLLKSPETLSAPFLCPICSYALHHVLMLVPPASPKCGEVSTLFIKGYNLREKFQNTFVFKMKQARITPQGWDLWERCTK